MASEHTVGFEPADELAKDRESVRRRSQPNQKASGSTRMICAGSTWAAAKASELTIQAATVPHRPASHP